MARFFVEGAAPVDGLIHIHGEDVDHIRKVLRLRPGDPVTVCNGDGIDYISEIDEITKEAVRVQVLQKVPNMAEPRLAVTLFQGVPKGEKMDLIIQKSVELGVTRVVPVITKRTVVRLEGTKDAAAKTTRWQRIALEAAKQSNRGRVPLIADPVTFQSALNLLEPRCPAAIPYEKEQGNGFRSFASSVGASPCAAVFIGPEGGFEEEEIHRAREMGVMPVTLGRRILRTETAGIAALSLLMYEAGEMDG